jgi:hypothetical protein
MEILELPRVQKNHRFQPPWHGGLPCIVENQVCDWAAFQRWTPDYLKRAASGIHISVREAIGPPLNIYQKLAQGGKIPFSDYLDWVLEISEGEDFRAIQRNHKDPANITRAVRDIHFEESYYLDAKLEESLPELLQDIKTPAWYSCNPIDAIFWCGVLGTSSGLHSDLNPNCNVQVFGKKHFFLFAPSQAKNLYRMAGRTHCHFDPNAPDFEKYPLARQAQGWQCYLRPGECLYIPVGWFHQVTVVSGWSMNVNFFWPRPFPQGLLTPALWPLLCRRSLAKSMRPFTNGLNYFSRQTSNN